MVNNKWINLYIIIFVFLLAHLFIGKLYSEPYPSLIYPSFAKVKPLKDEIIVPVSFVYTLDKSNDTIMLDKRKIFSEKQMIHSSDMVKTIIKKEILLNANKVTYSKELKNMIEERKMFIKRAIRNLKNKFVNQDFKSLHFVEGTKIYNLKKNQLIDSFSTKKTTIISLL